MKKLNQNLYLFILNALLISTLTACGGGSNGSSGNNDSSSIVENDDENTGNDTGSSGNDDNGNSSGDDTGSPGSDDNGTGNGNNGNTGGDDNGSSGGGHSGGHSGGNNGGNSGNNGNNSGNSGNDDNNGGNSGNDGNNGGNSGNDDNNGGNSGNDGNNGGSSGNDGNNSGNTGNDGNNGGNSGNDGNNSGNSGNNGNNGGNTGNDGNNSGNSGNDGNNGGNSGNDDNNGGNSSNDGNNGGNSGNDGNNGGNSGNDNNNGGNSGNDGNNGGNSGNDGNNSGNTGNDGNNSGNSGNDGNNGGNSGNDGNNSGNSGNDENDDGNDQNSGDNNGDTNDDQNSGDNNGDTNDDQNSGDDNGDTNDDQNSGDDNGDTNDDQNSGDDNGDTNDDQNSGDDNDESNDDQNSGDDNDESNNDQNSGDDNDESNNDQNSGDDNDESNDDQNSSDTSDDNNDDNTDVEEITDTVIGLSITEYGDMFSGKPYVLKYVISPADSNANPDTPVSQNFTINAEYGAFTRIHPQTGMEAPEGVIYYYVPENVLGTTENYYYFKEKITVTNPDNKSQTYTLPVGTNSSNGDSIFTDQWHIKNIGQNPFNVRIAPVPGIDLNVIPAWHLTDANNELISGKNVQVAVWDMSVDFNHEDLADQKYNPESTASFINRSLSLSEVKEDNSNLHGTMVAGIIGASANNGTGVRGIAYGAKMASYEANATNVAYLARRKDLHITNASLGLDNSFAYEPTLDLYYQSMFENGIPLIKAAGNEFERVTFNNSSYYPTQCSNYGISCQFNQTSSFNRGRYLINVAAINSLGKKSSYSTIGSHIWVSGTGGEFGYNGYSNSSAAIVTTKYSYNPEDYNEDYEYRTPWRTNQSTYDLRKNYTHMMNGTSSATPSVTGVSSLVMQAKPGLSVPQLRYILAVTANNDKTTGWSTLQYSPIKGAVSEYNGEEITFDNGWHDTASGLRFSNYYGFGVVNAYEAVKKALACDDDELCTRRSELPDDYISSGSNPCSSSDGGKNVTCHFTGFVNTDRTGQSASVIDIESTSLNLASFTYASDNSNTNCMNAVQGGISAVIYPNNLLQIEMISPNGTRALIKPVYANWDFSAKTLKSNLRASGYNNKFLVNVSEFFTEKVAADGIFTVKLKSKCNIDVDTLNQNIYVLLGGYAER